MMCSFNPTQHEARAVNEKNQQRNRTNFHSHDDDSNVLFIDVDCRPIFFIQEKCRRDL